MSEDAHSAAHPLDSFDAKVWAAEFMRLFGKRLHDLDEATMLGWFANALMRGYDEHALRSGVVISNIRRDAAGLSKAIIRHVRRHDEVPVEVAAMTEGESKLYALLLKDRGLLLFLADYLSNGIHLGDADGNIPDVPPDFYETLYMKDRIARAQIAIEKGAPHDEIAAILGGYDD